MTEGINATRSPIVRLTETNEAMADSRDVAAYFGKNHRDVLRVIREMPCSLDFRQRNFAPFKINDLAGESTSHVSMTKDGFTFLVMGFTGGRAAAYKERYIAAFNVMEAELRKAPTFLVPQTMGEALRLAADLSDTVAQQKLQIATLVPKGEAFDQFINASGLYGLQEGGRALACHPNLFIDWLKDEGHIFPGRTGLACVQDHIMRGRMLNKPVTARSGKAVTQAFITPKGLAYFASLVPAEIKSNKSAPQSQAA